MILSLALNAWWIERLQSLSIPSQSRAKTTVYPGSNLAAEDLGVHRSHLHRVLNGTRQSAALRRPGKPG